MSNLNQESLLSEVALRNAAKKINDSGIRNIALEHGLISLEYLLGIRKPSSKSREQFVKGLRLQLNGIYSRNTYQKVIEDYIKATVQLIENLGSENIKHLNKKSICGYKIPVSRHSKKSSWKDSHNWSKCSQKKSKTTRKKHTASKRIKQSYKVEKSSFFTKEQQERLNEIHLKELHQKLSSNSFSSEEKPKENNKTPGVDKEPSKENNSSKNVIKSNKYSNRPMPTNGYTKGKLDPSQTKRAPDDREDWKKINPSRY